MGTNTVTWPLLMSGAVGSFVAALIGGLVALLVVRLTNRQQRNNAREGREIDAISEFVAATGGMVKKYRDPDTVQDLLLIAEAAVVKWDINTDLEELGEEVHAWPYLLANLALDVFTASKEEDDAARGRAFDTLSEAQAWLMVFVTAWPKKSRSDRKREIKRMVEKRQELQGARPASAGPSSKAPSD